MCSVSALVMCDVDRPPLKVRSTARTEVWGRLQSCKLCPALQHLFGNPESNAAVGLSRGLNIGFAQSKSARLRFEAFSLTLQGRCEWPLMSSLSCTEVAEGAGDDDGGAW